MTGAILTFVRIAFRALLTVAILYAVIVAGLAIAMRQPPDTFGAIMAKVPNIAFAVLPFETLWMNARAGHLQVGNPAPDFILNAVDGAKPVELSSLRGRLVVLIFGSYT